MAPTKKTAPKSAPKRVHKVASASSVKTAQKVSKPVTSKTTPHTIAAKKPAHKSAAPEVPGPVSKSHSATSKSTVQVAKSLKSVVSKVAPKAAAKVAVGSAPKGAAVLKAAAVKAPVTAAAPVEKKQPVIAAAKMDAVKPKVAAATPKVAAGKPVAPAVVQAAPKPVVAAQQMAARPLQNGQRAMPAMASSKPGQQKLTAPAAPAAIVARPGMPASAAASATNTAAAIAAAANKKPVNARHGFKTNEFVVYPAHGVGRIIGIEEQEIAGISLELFVIQFEKDKMTLRVPTSKLQSVGMRKLAEEGIVKRAMETLKGKARIKRTMWSRRAQEYEAKINSGDLVAIAEVVRDLYRSEAQPEQSYSERQLYEAALDRMGREIAAVEKLDERSAMQRITEVLSKSARGRRAAEEEAAASGAEVKAA